MKNRKLIGLAMLIVAWELLAYTASDFFFPAQVRKTGSYGGRFSRVWRGDGPWHWADAFNKDLFHALNIVGLALLLVLIGYSIFRGSPSSKIKRAE